jgi:hypothetical protein
MPRALWHRWACAALCLWALALVFISEKLPSQPPDDYHGAFERLGRLAQETSPHFVAEVQSSLLLVDPADERETREAVVRALTGAHIGLPSRSHGQVLAIHGLRRGASLFAGQLAQTLSLAVLDGGILPPTLGNEVRHEGFA